MEVIEVKLHIFQIIITERVLVPCYAETAFTPAGQWNSRIRTVGKVKGKFSPYRPWRPLGLRDVESTTFSDIRPIDGDKVVSPTRRPLFTARKIPGIHIW
jgi:hypothetical protein